MKFDRKIRVKINSKVFDSNNWKNRIAIKEKTGREMVGGGEKNQ